MARINLLPWRETQREVRQKQFFVSLGVAAGLAVLLHVVSLAYFKVMEGEQLNRVQYLEQEIAEQDRQIREIRQLQAARDELLQRMRLIATLQESRPHIVRVLDTLVRVLPDGIHLDTLTRQGSRWVLDGVAQSNARVSVLMREIEAAAVFQVPQLRVIQRTTTREDAIRRFSLEVNEASLSSVDDDETL